MVSDNKAYIIGVGMTKFIKPRDTYGYEELGLEAAVKALLDSTLNYDEIERAVAGYVYGDSTSGQRTLYQLGITGIPIYNVNNNCSTGSTALSMGRDFVESGLSDVVLCVGFEKMKRGSLGSNFQDRTDPLDRFVERMGDSFSSKVSPACQFFANGGDEYIRLHGPKNKTDGADALARIAQINHAHSVNNPYSQFQDVYTLEQIKQSPKVFKQTTKLQCCPTSDGAAAVVVVSGRYLNKNPHLIAQAIEIAGQSLQTDGPMVFSGSAIDLIGYDMTKRAAESVYKQGGVTPKDIQVYEVHDCFAANELCVLDALGLCEPGRVIDLVNEGKITYDTTDRAQTRYLVNPSGGLISKGHPLGATGLAQAAELVWHLRGLATNRALPHTRYCLQHNLGLGGAVVVTLYKRVTDGTTNAAQALTDAKSKFGYNPAVEARHITLAQFEKVRSRTSFDKFAVVGNRLTGEGGDHSKAAKL